MERDEKMWRKRNDEGNVKQGKARGEPGATWRPAAPPD
jgi:hypothetical protein